MGFSARHWTAFRMNENGNGFDYCDSEDDSAKVMELKEMIEFVRETLKNEGEVFWVYKL